MKSNRMLIRLWGRVCLSSVRCGSRCRDLMQGILFGLRKLIFVAALRTQGIVLYIAPSARLSTMEAKVLARYWDIKNRSGFYQVSADILKNFFHGGRYVFIL